MSEERNPQNEQIDEDLAKYTDKLIQDNEAPDNNPAGLGRTVEQLWAMSKDSTPSQDAKERIHSAIADEWQQTYGKDPAPTIWQRVVAFFVPPENEWRSRSQVTRTAMSRLTVAVVMVLVLGLAITSETSSSSAAAGQADIAPWIVTGVVVITGFLWLWVTREN